MPATRTTTAQKKKTASVKASAKPKAKPVQKATKTTAKKAAPKKATVAKKAPQKVTPPKALPKKAAKVKGLSEMLLDTALKILDDRQAENVVTVDLRGRSPLADYAIIASGRSSRQLAAMAEYVREACFKMGNKKVRIEGLPQADWVLIDTGDVLIHLFRPDVRDYYNIEDVWSPERAD